jgi:hypothetical protein
MPSDSWADMCVSVLPLTFEGLIEASEPLTELGDGESVPWLIDNKYYSARVYLRLAVLDAGAAALDGREEGVPVIMYLFENAVSVGISSGSVSGF